MLNRKWIVTTAAVAGFSLASLVRADEPMDKRFIKEAAESCMAEDQISRLAADHAHNSDVKHFAEESLGGEKKLLEELRNVAHGHDYHIPNEMSEKQHDKYKELERLHGNEFDMAYMSSEAEDQKNLADLFESAKHDCSDKNLREFADRKLDYVKNIRDKADDLNKQIQHHDR